MRARCEALLELLRRHGCASGDALAHFLGLTHAQAYYALLLLAWRGLVARYALGRAVAWCAGGPPGTLLVRCGGRLLHLGVGRLAEEAARLVESGLRALRPARLARALLGAGCAKTVETVAAILRAALGDAAEKVRSGRGVMLLVADPEAAVERLRRVAESGVLPLEPAPLPARTARLLPRSASWSQNSARRGRMVMVTFYLPASMLEWLDSMVKRGAFHSRSEAIREALRRLWEEEARGEARGHGGR